MMHNKRLAQDTQRSRMKKSIHVTSSKNSKNKRSSTTSTQRRVQWVLALLVGFVAAAVMLSTIGFMEHKSGLVSRSAMAQVQKADGLSWLMKAAKLVASGQKSPKINTPLITMDLSARYYKAVLASMVENFKKSIHRQMCVTKKSNATSGGNDDDSLPHVSTAFMKPIALQAANKTATSTKQLTVNDLKLVEGNGGAMLNVIIKDVDVERDESARDKSAKLRVEFIFKTLKVYGKMFNDKNKKLKASLDKKGKVRPLLIVKGMNSTWAGSMLEMIGRDSFDMSKVSVKHSMTKTQFHVKDCPADMQPLLKNALITSLEKLMSDRINAAMSQVVMDAEADGRKRGDGSHDGTDDDDDDDFEFESDSAKQLNASLTIAPSASVSTKPSPNAVRRSKRQAESDESSPTTTTAPEGEECDQTLDEYVDDLFKFAMRLARSMEPLPAPNVTIDLPDYNLQIFLYEGKITRSYTFKRAKEAWLFCSNNTRSLGLTVLTNETRVMYKYRVISGHRLLFDGDMQLKMSPRIQAQLSQKKKKKPAEDSGEPEEEILPGEQRLERVRIMRLGKVVVILRGLGNLTQSLALMLNSYLNDNQDELAPTFRMIESDIMKMANKMLAAENGDRFRSIFGMIFQGLKDCHCSVFGNDSMPAKDGYYYPQYYARDQYYPQPLYYRH